jgi:hypothetical protein
MTPPCPEPEPCPVADDADARDEADAALVDAQAVEEDGRAWLRELTAFLTAVRPSRAFGGVVPMGSGSDGASPQVQRERDRAIAAVFRRVGRISRGDLKR